MQISIGTSTPDEAESVASVVREAAIWLEETGQPNWLPNAITTESVRAEASAGRYLVARTGEEIVGVVQFQFEDPDFWPEVAPGTSLFLHRLNKVFQKCCLTLALKRLGLLSPPMHATHPNSTADGLSSFS